MGDFAPVKFGNCDSKHAQKYDALEDSDKQSNCTYHNFSHLLLMQTTKQ